MGQVLGKDFDGVVLGQMPNLGLPTCGQEVGAHVSNQMVVEVDGEDPKTR